MTDSVHAELARLEHLLSSGPEPEGRAELESGAFVRALDAAGDALLTAWRTSDDRMSAERSVYDGGHGDAAAEADDAARFGAAIESWAAASDQTITGLQRARALAAAAAGQALSADIQGRARALVQQIDEREDALRKYLRAQQVANRVVMNARVERLVEHLSNASWRFDSVN